MTALARLKRFGFDFYLVLLIGAVVLATVLPAQGAWASIVSGTTYFAVALLFFLYGARLQMTAIVAGIANWRLQLLVFVTTFVIFPILGLAMSAVVGTWLPPEVAVGLLYLSLLPSTVQSSIAFTSIAGGNVPAAVCAASASNLIGVFLTPLLVGMFIHSSAQGGGFNTQAVLDIGLQILLPFAVGQLVRPLVRRFLEAHRRLVGFVDRGSILLIVYSAFSAGVVAGMWQQVDVLQLAIVIVAAVILLAAAMAITTLLGRAFNLPREDRLVLFFCGSKKSLASGLPMANILFAGQAISLILLPVMLFHQIQLFVCAIVAQRSSAAAQLDAAAKS